MPVTRGVDPKAYTLIGYPVFGGRAIRGDVAERLHATLIGSGEGEGEGEREGEVVSQSLSTGQLASRLGCPAREVSAIMTELMAS